ncbi:hypothetical protein C8F04DRAFT_1067890 [Mycena alexandri]|uniref:Uncharacterized protein n=1 Tax=Mycena alexandri TaxID=1745969 RepID=A0AAD6XEA9_9AGAR|nr:hypothetical protein C8F04DRAFT_1067890 [Mycena alexandri]
MHPPPSILKASPEPDLFHPPLPESTSSNPLPFTACTSRVFYSPHVHFPSTPRLTFIGATHSPGTYDRAPIAVSPNSCAMPERGGRVYGSPEQRCVGSYFHPRAFEACELELEQPVPLLHPDLSSETDEWSTEECLSPKSASPEPHVAVRMAGTPYPTPIPSTHTQAEFDHALSFLPHPPVPEKRGRSPRRQSVERPRPPLKSVTFKVDDAESESCLDGF